MKQFIMNIFGLQSLVDQAYTEGYSKASSESKQKESDRALRKLMINYPIGSEVMHLSGQSPIQRATVVGYEDFGHSKALLMEDASGRRFTTGGKVIHFNQNRWDSFQKLSWWEQHNVGTEWGPSFDVQKATNLIEGRPAWDNGNGEES